MKVGGAAPPPHWTLRTVCLKKKTNKDIDEWKLPDFQISPPPPTTNFIHHERNHVLLEGAGFWWLDQSSDPPPPPTPPPTPPPQFPRGWRVHGVAADRCDKLWLPGTPPEEQKVEAQSTHELQRAPLVCLFRDWERRSRRRRKKRKTELLLLLKMHLKERRLCFNSKFPTKEDKKKHFSHCWCPTSKHANQIQAGSVAQLRCPAPD